MSSCAGFNSLNRNQVAMTEYTKLKVADLKKPVSYTHLTLPTKLEV